MCLSFKINMLENLIGNIHVNDTPSFECISEFELLKLVSFVLKWNIMILIGIMKVLTFLLLNVYCMKCQISGS